jgi:hypothetical protein
MPAGNVASDGSTANSVGPCTLHAAHPITRPHRSLCQQRQDRRRACTWRIASHSQAHRMTDHIFAPFSWILGLPRRPAERPRVPNHSAPARADPRQSALTLIASGLPHYEYTFVVSRFLVFRTRNKTSALGRRTLNEGFGPLPVRSEPEIGTLACRNRIVGKRPVGTSIKQPNRVPPSGTAFTDALALGRKETRERKSAAVVR